MSWCVSPWVYPVWDSLVFLDLGDYFLPHFREVFNYYLLKYFLMVCLSVFFFWDSYNSNVGAFHIVLEVSEIVLISFNSFLFFLSDSFISTVLSSTSLILSSASIILLFVASRVFICDSILISRFWIIFTINIWNSLSGRFPISSSLVWFGGHSSCYFTCWVFLRLFILFILLHLGWPFCILAVCGVLFIVEFPCCGWGCTGGLSRFLG